MQDLPPSASWGVFLCERDTLMWYPGWIRTHLRSPALEPCLVSVNAFCAVFLGCPWVIGYRTYLEYPNPQMLQDPYSKLCKFCRNWDHCVLEVITKERCICSICAQFCFWCLIICFVVVLFLFFLYSFVTGWFNLWIQSLADMEE